MIIGFIGTGNMGGALARAVRSARPNDVLLLSDASSERAEALAQEVGGDVVDNRTVAMNADYIFLGVKPQMLQDMLSGIVGLLRSRADSFTIISMAAGVPISRLKQLCGRPCPIIRIMPNTPVSVGEGAVLYSVSEGTSPEAVYKFCEIMANAGRLMNIDERLIDAASAISGCGPAYADLFSEALADGGVACGLPRNTAIALASQMLLGSAKLQLETGKHPGELKDAVCSPAGSTIEGVKALEDGCFRSAVINAVISAYKRTKELG